MTLSNLLESQLDFRLVPVIQELLPGGHDRKGPQGLHNVRIKVGQTHIDHILGGVSGFRRVGGMLMALLTIERICRSVLFKRFFP